MFNKTLGNTDITISNIGLGTMTFGEQVDENTSFNILDCAIDNGINFIDTAEIYSAPTRRETYGLTETIIGRWLKDKQRANIILGGKVAGPDRGNNPWIREGQGLTANDIINSCEKSLKRLNTDYIDLFQIHWPERYSPKFGELYYDPAKDYSNTSIYEQLEALNKLINEGKIRYIGLANETPYGVSEFIRISDLYNLPRVQSVQNHYSLTNRSYENGLDEMLYKHNISMIAYSPLSFGILTGKYDNINIDDIDKSVAGRLNKYTEYTKRKWCNKLTLKAAKAYNTLARESNLSPTELALSYCYNKWSIGCTLVGVTSTVQLIENISASSIVLSDDILEKINEIRWLYRDPTI